MTISKKQRTTDIPNWLRNWIEVDCPSLTASQRELLISVLDEVADCGQLSLFRTREHTGQSPLFGIPFTFIDLFSGIGGFRLGLESLGGECLFSCEWDKHAQKTYEAWFGERPEGDIREIDATRIPDHDILAAGFPCQPFSIAGVSKKKSLGKEHGFKDATQGTLFFYIAEIIEIKRPPVVLLENVKNLRSHN